MAQARKHACGRVSDANSLRWWQRARTVVDGISVLIRGDHVVVGDRALRPRFDTRVRRGVQACKTDRARRSRRRARVLRRTRHAGSIARCRPDNVTQ